MTHFSDATDYNSVTFKKVDHSGKSVRESTFSECTFTRCVFNESRFLGCRFRECIFEDCSLKLAKVDDSMFALVRFSRCNLLGIDWTTADWSQWATRLHALEFDACGMEYAVFLGVDLKKATFRNCVAREANFAEADLSEADFAGSDLEAAVFLRTNLTKANFVGAKNYTLSLLDNKTQGARFSLPEAIRLLHSLPIVVVDDSGQESADA